MSVTFTTTALQGRSTSGSVNEQADNADQAFTDLDLGAESSFAPSARVPSGFALVRVSDLPSSALPLTLYRLPSGSAASIHTVHAFGVHSFTLRELCLLIDSHGSMASADIVTASCYSQTVRFVKHRFLILELSRPGRKTLWLRLDRRTDPMTSLFRLILNGVSTPANDVVCFRSISLCVTYNPHVSCLEPTRLSERIASPSL
jgi:hypothetical protein